VSPLPLLEFDDFLTYRPARQGALALVQETTTPDDCLISKENRLHFLAGRLAPPHLSLISTARLFSGLLPAQAIMDQAAQYGCPLLVYTDTFDKLIPDLRERAGAFYAVKLTLRSPQEPDYDLEVYALPLDTVKRPAQPNPRQVDDQFRLHGWWLAPEPVSPGAPVQLATYWEALRPADADYKVFVHWVDAQGTLVAGFDHPPFPLNDAYQVVDVALNPALLADGRGLPAMFPASLLPTSLWQPGRTLKETYTMTAPADLAPGAYTVLFGLYDEMSGARLPITDPATGAVTDHVVAGTVEVR
jgi:hypothetical protein